MEVTPAEEESAEESYEDQDSDSNQVLQTETKKVLSEIKESTFYGSKKEGSFTLLQSLPSAVSTTGKTRKTRKITQQKEVKQKKEVCKRGKKQMQTKKSNKNIQHQKGNDGNSDWQDVTGIFVNPNQSVPFLEYSGLSRNAASAKSPLDFFFLFFSYEMFKNIAQQTNLYQGQMTNLKPSPMKWLATTAEEMMAFIGMNIAMGIANLPEIDDYWSKSSLFYMPWFTGIFTRNRFKQILRYLHLVDNSKDLPRNDPNRNRLFKLGNIVQNLNKSFREMYFPSQNLSLDEQMIGTKSRIGFLQYMPKKPKKFGIKLWALCEAATGYCLQFQVYAGKTDGTAEHGLVRRVVFDLMGYYLDKGFHLFFDNFYTSLKLLKDMILRNTYCCGTIRSNRGEFPNKFKTDKLEKGSTVYLKNGNILAVHWKDKRDVYALSSFHGNSEKIVERFSGEISKPDMICDYNQNMGGVDKCDQFLSYYSLGRKSMKWWKKVFFRLVELCIVNAMCLYFHANPEFAKQRQAHKKFRIMLVHALVQPLLDKRDERESSKSSNTPIAQHPRNKIRVADDVRLRGKHYPVSRFPSRRKCVACAYKVNAISKKRKDKKTCNYCEKCDAFICKQCFRSFHSRASVK